ncbi:MAG TPA: glycosyltransferase family A protein [Candidatus Acidoferrales bacterium]|nr:glycosyltransferase family A protein [Candidatus Acidoferrales bacterium]
MKDSFLKVSVVIPVHNEEKYIGRCLDSLMKQNIKPEEIIIVDNNSTDSSVEIAKKYPVRIISEKQQGITPARNRGFNEARFDIIARTDADTILPINWIKRIKNAFADEQLVGISGPASFYDLPKIFKRSWQSKTTSIQFIKSYNSIVRQILKHDCLYGPNLAIRKNEWNKIKNSVCLDDSKVHEDIDLAIHLAPLGKIKFIRTLTVKTSVRRWKRPEAYIEYLYRGLKSIQRHKQLAVKQRSKQFVKKVVEKAFFFDQIPSDFK